MSATRLILSLAAPALILSAGFAARAEPASSAYKPTIVAQDRATTTTTGATKAVNAGATDVEKLIGRNVRNANDEKIGDINAVYLDRNGKVASVIVGVGGFLGVGEKEVAIDWKDIKVLENGERVTTGITKAQIEALPKYEYKDPKWRGTVFSQPM